MIYFITQGHRIITRYFLTKNNNIKITWRGADFDKHYYITGLFSHLRLSEKNINKSNINLKIYSKKYPQDRISLWINDNSYPFH